MKKEKNKGLKGFTALIFILSSLGILILSIIAIWNPIPIVFKLGGTFFVILLSTFLMAYVILKAEETE